MAFFQYLVFDGENMPLPDSYEVELEEDTSYKGLWTVSFTLKEM